MYMRRKSVRDECLGGMIASDHCLNRKRSDFGDPGDGTG